MEARVLTPAAGPPPPSAGGFTLLEVLIAMVILGVTLLGVQAAMTDRLIRDVGQHDRQTLAMQLVMDRLQAVQVEPVYSLLEPRYAGTEDPVPGFPGYVRATTVVRTRSDVADHTTVTVTVTRAGLPQPVSRSVTLAAP